MVCASGERARCEREIGWYGWALVMRCYQELRKTKTRCRKTRFLHLALPDRQKEIQTREGPVTEV